MCAVLQSYGVDSGAAWIGLNSVPNPGKQQWQWAGGQHYDPTVQVPLQWPPWPSPPNAALLSMAIAEAQEPVCLRWHAAGQHSAVTSPGLLL